MSRELMTKYPQIKDYCTVWMENITHTTARGSSEFGLTNTNKLIRQYEYATGLKTGSTGKAKFCVSATASKNGVDLIAVIMGAEDSKSRFKDAVTLLNYGFGKCQIYKAKERKLPSVLVKGGKEDHLKIQYEEGFTYVDTEGSDLSKVEEVTEIPDEVKAPVKKRGHSWPDLLSDKWERNWIHKSDCRNTCGKGRFWRLSKKKIWKKLL